MKETSVLTLDPGLDLTFDNASMAKKNKIKSRSKVTTPNHLK
jgi:hypothetical protein